MAKSRDQYGEVSIHPMGRYFELGQFYDVCHDKELSVKSITIKPSSVSANTIPLKPYHSNCMPDEIFEKLYINSKFRLELHLGVNSFSGGIVAFVKDAHEKDFSSGTSYLYTYTYKSEQVEPSILRGKYLKKILEKIPENATHVVQEITYGCNTIIWMDDEQSKDPKKGVPIFENLPHITLSHASGKANICFEAKALKSMPCKMYSDVKPITPCNNLHEALQHLEYVQREAVPIRVTLIPVAEATIHREVGHKLSLAKYALDILRDLRVIERRCLQLLNDPKREKCEKIQEKLEKFHKLITEHRREIVPKLEMQIRNSNQQEKTNVDIEAFLNNAGKSPFNFKLLEEWLKKKEQDWDKIEEAIKRFPILQKCSQTSSSDSKYSFDFVIQLPKEDQLLQKMSEYRFGQGDGAPQQHLSETNITTAFDESCKTFQEILQRLKGGKESTFLVDVEEADVPFLSGSIRFYRNSDLLDNDFKLPRQPTGLKVEEVTYTSFQLSWMTSDQKPKYESHEIIVSGEDCECKYKSKVDHLKIDKLDPRTEFIVTMYSLYGPIRSEPSQEIQITTLPSEKLPLTGVHKLHKISGKQSPTKQQILDVLAPPGRPEFLEISSRKLRLRWEPPKKSTKSVSKYLVFDAEKMLMTEVKGDKTDAEISIFPNVPYQFTVKAEWDNGEKSEHSEPSDTFEKKMSQDELRIENIKRQSTCITKSGENPQLYLLNIKKIGGNKNIQKFEFGTKKWNVPEKVVMLLGSTGSGKTTLINGMANFILGIKWDDDFRIKLVPEEEGACDQTQSQTKHITSYTIHPEKEFRIPFSLTLVDTPGFGDTSGLKADQEIMDQIKEFFTAEGDLGLDHIDGIGLVVQSSLARLTPTMKYIFDSILSLFGKDVAENIFPLLTFADGQPQVLDALESAKILHNLYYTFNNSALYANKSKKAAFNQMFWEMGEENFGKFFNSLPEVKARSFYLTKEVLEERNKLEAQIQGIRHDIEVGLHKKEELECEWTAIQQHQEEIKRNKDFTYITTETFIYKKPLDHGGLAMNCSRCYWTCHYPCRLKSSLYLCQKLSKTGFCSSCPQGCKREYHEQTPYKYVTEWRDVTRTSDDLKKKYQKAKDEKLKHEKILQSIASDINQTHVNLTEKVLEVKKCVTRLEEIALKPSSPSTVEYVEQMIDEEKLSRESGWKKRVKQLEEVKETAQFVDSMIKDGFDPFDSFSETLKKVKIYMSHSTEKAPFRGSN